MSYLFVLERVIGVVIMEWCLEDLVFWQQCGYCVVSCNLWIFVLCLLLVFCVWMLFSVVVVNLLKVGFNFMIDQFFMLIVLLFVFGVLLWVFYFFMVLLFGGCCWIVFSIGIFIVFCVWLGFVVQDISMLFSIFIIIFLLCGFVGVNFVFSMVNISFFFFK